MLNLQLLQLRKNKSAFKIKNVPYKFTTPSIKRSIRETHPALPSSQSTLLCISHEKRLTRVLLRLPHGVGIRMTSGDRNSVAHSILDIIFATICPISRSGPSFANADFQNPLSSPRSSIRRIKPAFDSYSDDFSSVLNWELKILEFQFFKEESSRFSFAKKIDSHHLKFHKHVKSIVFTAAKNILMFLK